MQSFIHNLGDFLDIFGGYLVVRFFIPDGETVRRTIKTLAVVCIIQGVCMLNEQILHVNVFGYVGGLWARAYDKRREDPLGGSAGMYLCRSVRGGFDSIISVALDRTKMPECLPMRVLPVRLLWYSRRIRAPRSWRLQHQF